MLLCVCNWKKTDHLKNILPTLPFMIRNGQVRIYLYSGLRDRVPDWLNRLARTLASMGWTQGTVRPFMPRESSSSGGSSATSPPSQKRFAYFQRYQVEHSSYAEFFRNVGVDTWSSKYTRRACAAMKRTKQQREVGF